MPRPNPKRLAILCFVLLMTQPFLALADRTLSSDTDQIIVKFNDDFIDGQGIAPGLSRQINKTLQYVRQTGSGAHIYKLKAREDINQVAGFARAIQAIPGVAYAEPDHIMHPLALSTPNDPFYAGYQWHYYEATGGINAPAAWSHFNSSDGPVYVAVLDTGKTDHADLESNLVAGYDMIDDSFVANDGDGRDDDPSDPGDWVGRNECGFGTPSYGSSWHGTHVSGTIAAATNNGAGVAGITYNLAKIVPVRVLGKCGGYVSDIADGILWAIGQTVSGSTNAHPVKVINMSLGGSGSCNTDYQNAINAAVNAGTTVVVAAGNSNANAGSFQPANCQNVVTVAATNRSGGKAYYSNYGSAVDLSAPGGETNSSASNGIASTLNSGSTSPQNDTYVWYQGTSMATPHVAGVAALMYVKNPDLTPAGVESLLKNTARSFPATCSQCGSGIVDAGAAVTGANGGSTEPENLPPIVDNSGPFSVQENSAATTSVGQVLAHDPENNDLTYAITGGNTGGAFAIGSTDGSITVANAVLDYETISSYILSVDISDGLLTTSTDVAVEIINDPSDDDPVTPPTSSLTDADSDGFYVEVDDCNDNDAHVYPGHNDTKGKWGRDGVDNDCDGAIDG